MKFGYCENCRRFAYKHQFVCPECGAALEKLPHSKLRSKILHYLGFKSYREYLASDLWRDIRSRVLAKYDNKCTRCGGDATQVHHMSYCLVAMNGEDIGSLRPLCAGCHKFIEFHPNGIKAKFSTVQKKLAGSYNPKSRYRSKPLVGKYYAKKRHA